MEQEIDAFKSKSFTGTNMRLLEEWNSIINRFQNNNEISILIRERNAAKLPIVYDVVYNIRSFCGVKEKDENGLEMPILAKGFTMRISIPNNFPSVESKLDFRFLTEDILEINKIPHPWHPNIRYFGDFAGKVCLNKAAFSTYTDLALFIERVSLYLKYEKYHAEHIEPYPEDDLVANWVLEQAEPNGWIDDLRNSNEQ